MNCLSENIVVALVQGAHARPPELDAHIDQCEACRALLAGATMALHVPAEPVPPENADTLPGPSDSHGTVTFVSGTLVGRYHLLDCVGMGGMGAVYAAYDPKLDRKVAVKLLRAQAHESNSPAELRARLLREAQAMARLAHPNVMAVHDVGVFQDQIFVAMDFVAGSTLRRWMSAQERDLAATLDIFLQAGRGLSAAHAAGLVHRDFKPDNVLIGSDGRVCVTDFGLARAMGASQELGSLGSAPQSSQSPKPPKSPLEPLDTLPGALTRSGTLVGTPAYMAPEQYSGGLADARTDQFSFCVALYEALYGERPFTGRTVETLASQIMAGQVRAPARQKRVPLWLRRILLRGLSVAPSDRYPSMEALLSELGRDWRAARRRMAVLAVFVLLLGTAVGGLAHQRHKRLASCQTGAQQVARVWGSDAQRRVRAAFLATNLPYAADVWSGVSRRLGAYAQEWAAMHDDACQATHVRREQSEEMLELRDQCLERRKEELAALARLFTSAKAQTVEKGVQAASSLAPVASCADMRALTSLAHPRLSPDAQAKHEGLQRLLANASVLEVAGQFKEGIAAARQAAAQAKALGDQILGAEALYLLGRLEGRTHDPAAERTLYEAAWAAEAARHDEISAHAWAFLVFVQGRELHKFEEAHRSARQAEAAIARMGGSKVLESEILSRKGLLLDAEGRLPEALAAHERALALAEEAYGKSHPATAASLMNVANVLGRQGKNDDALPYDQRALAIREEALGPRHPDVGLMLNNLANVQINLGQFEDAADLLRRSLAILEGKFGPDHPDLLFVLINLGRALEGAGYMDEALAAQERALRIAEKAHGVDSYEAGVALSALGGTLVDQERYAQATSLLRRAVTTFEQKLGPNHPDLGIVLGTLGRAELGSHGQKAAWAHASRAMKLTQGPPAERAVVEFWFAEALWQTSGDRDRALRLAREAIPSMEQGTKVYSTEKDRAQRWLALHERS